MISTANCITESRRLSERADFTPMPETSEDWAAIREALNVDVLYRALIDLIEQTEEKQAA